MATKSEEFHAEEARRARGAKKPTAARKKPDSTSNASERAGKKATYALEEGSSRKSTRGSANRVKPDAALNIREELVNNTPKARHGREAARS